MCTVRYQFKDNEKYYNTNKRLRISAKEVFFWNGIKNHPKVTFINDKITQNMKGGSSESNEEQNKEQDIRKSRKGVLPQSRKHPK